MLTATQNTRCSEKSQEHFVLSAILVKQKVPGPDPSNPL